MTRTEMNK